MIYEFNWLYRRLRAAKSKRNLWRFLSLQRVKASYRTRNYATNDCIVEPSQSAWSKLFHGGNDGNLIASIGLNYEGFNKLLTVFRRFYGRNPVSRAGRHRRLDDARDVLGLVLTFYSDKQRYNKLGAHFGVGMAVLSRTLE